MQQSTNISILEVLQKAVDSIDYAMHAVDKSQLSEADKVLLDSDLFTAYDNAAAALEHVETLA